MYFPRGRDFSALSGRPCHDFAGQPLCQSISCIAAKRKEQFACKLTACLTGGEIRSSVFTNSALRPTGESWRERARGERRSGRPLRPGCRKGGSSLTSVRPGAPPRGRSRDGAPGALRRRTGAGGGGLRGLLQAERTHRQRLARRNRAHLLALASHSQRCSAPRRFAVRPRAWPACTLARGATPRPVGLDSIPTGMAS